MSKMSEQIVSGMKEAMKAKDSMTLNTLRGLKSALTNAAIEKGSLTTILDEAEELAVVRKQIKQREDSVEQYDKAGRSDLSDKEKDEIIVLQQFLPAPMSDDEIASLLDGVIAETGATSRKDMGQVMKLMKERTEGRVDGKTLSSLIGARLS